MKSAIWRTAIHNSWWIIENVHKLISYFPLKRVISTSKQIQKTWNNKHTGQTKIVHIFSSIHLLPTKICPYKLSLDSWTWNVHQQLRTKGSLVVKSKRIFVQIKLIWKITIINWQYTSSTSTQNSPRVTPLSYRVQKKRPREHFGKQITANHT